MDILQTFEHNGRILQIAAYEPEPETTLAPSALGASPLAPGTGKFKIDPLVLSAEKIAPGESLSLSVHITGENIAFIYTEILIRDTELGQFYGPVAQEYVLSGKNAESHGVPYPLWDADINLALKLTPSLRILTDSFDSGLIPDRMSSADQVAAFSTPM